MYLRAAFRVNLLNRSTIWNHESAHDIFSATMSEKCFEFIGRFITFDGKTSRPERWKSDKFACLRELFEQMNENNSRWRNPSELLANNTALASLQSTFYYIEVYVILLQLILSLHYHMLVNLKLLKVLHPNYYITGTDEYTKYLVNEISKHNSIEGSNILMDRYFTSVSLAKWALKKCDDYEEPCATTERVYQNN